MNNSVVCPHCGEPISIDEVYAKEIEDKILTHERQAHSKALESARAESRAEAEKKLADQFQLTIKNLTDSLAEERERSGKFSTQISDLMKEIRKTRQEKEDSM